jgi:MoxR-like ATPase
MATNVKNLLPAHIVSTETRQRIHDLTDTPKGPTMAQRAAFAASRGERNVTKYWSVNTVLEACDLWAIMPVLGKGGARFVKQQGGLTFSPRPFRDGPETPKPEPKNPEPAQEPQMPTRPYFGEAQRPEPVKPADPDADAERQRKLAALESMIASKVAAAVDAARGRDDEALTDLIAGVSQAAAGAVLDTKGKALLDRLAAEGQARIAEALRLIDEARPVVLEIRVPDRPPARVKGRVHAAFKRVLRLAMARKNIVLIGPTGSGKTHLAAQVAGAITTEAHPKGLPYASQSVTMGMSESKIVGGLMPIGEGGRFEMFVADFIRLFRDGGVFLLDEWDAVDPNVALIVNQALANGHIDLPLLGCVQRHPDFIAMAAMNTFGTGADRQYVGRSQLDEASLDRFRIGQVHMDYDRDMERDLVGAQHEAWLERAWQVRDAIRASRLRRNMSTRFILDGRDMIDAGDSIDEVLTAYSLDWSPDDRAKVGITPVALY